jgi:peptidoglycan/xylan/chitin deacetylase (PgdA/CDA1 family)
LHTRLDRLPAPEIDRYLDGLLPDGNASDAPRVMAPDEVAQLDAHPLVNVGSHTMTHSKLSLLPPAQQMWEITESGRRLAAICGRPITDFAYPFGTRDSFTRSAERAAKRTYARVCVNVPRPVRRTTRSYRIPRFVVRNWSGDALLEELERWLS